MATGSSQTRWADVKVLEIKRQDLREHFDELYSVLSPQAALDARSARP
jgi:hypothetical protein